MVDQGVTFPGDSAPISRQNHQEMDDLNEMRPGQADDINISMEDDFQPESSFHDTEADALIAELDQHRAEPMSAGTVGSCVEPMEHGTPVVGSNLEQSTISPKVPQKAPAPPKKSKKGFRVLTPSVFKSKEERNAWMDDGNLFSL